MKQGIKCIKCKTDDWVKQNGVINNFDFVKGKAPKKIIPIKQIVSLYKCKKCDYIYDNVDYLEIRKIDASKITVSTMKIN